MFEICDGMITSDCPPYCTTEAPSFSAIDIKEENSHFANMNIMEVIMVFLCWLAHPCKNNKLFICFSMYCLSLSKVGNTCHKKAMISRDATSYTCGLEANETYNGMMRPYNNVIPVLEICLCYFWHDQSGSCLLYCVRFVTLLIHLRLSSGHRMYCEQSVPSFLIHLEWHRTSGIRIMESNIHHIQPWVAKALHTIDTFPIFWTHKSPLLWQSLLQHLLFVEFLAGFNRFFQLRILTYPLFR